MNPQILFFEPIAPKWSLRASKHQAHSRWRGTRDGFR